VVAGGREWYTMYMWWEIVVCYKNSMLKRKSSLVSAITLERVVVGTKERLLIIKLC